MAQQTTLPTPDQKRDAAEAIVRRLQQSGHVAYFAGGCVRDQLIGHPPKDYDVATSATPDAVKHHFRNTRRVGEAFGVVLVRLRRCEIEVATFRRESGYTDGRRPDHVAYTDAEHDALRRDFTVNGLFLDPVTNEVHDYVGGRADIAAQRIRAIGDPQERFAEDYLRMLRAVRFASRLGWTIDPPTRRAIQQNAPKLGLISRERIGMEMRLMLAEPTRATAARLTQDLDLDAPALDDEHIRGEPRVLAALPNDSSFTLALAAWLVDRRARPEGPTDVPEAIRRIKAVRHVRIWRNALSLSNDERDRVRDLLLRLPDLLDWPRLTVAQRKRLIAESQWTDLRALGRAMTAVHDATDFAALDADASDLRSDGVAPPPLITGDDLIADGLPAGPIFKHVLEAVYDAQLEHRVTDRSSAMALARAAAARFSRANRD